MNRQSTDQVELIAAIKANHEAILKDLYLENYPKIEFLVLKNNGSKMQAKDIYQEAFLTVWKNVCTDKFIPEGVSGINGYLYRIAKNKWTDYLRSADFKKRFSLNEKFSKNFQETEMENLESEIEKDLRLKKVMDKFNSLGEACKELLTAFYFDKRSLREIAKERNITEASARNKKYRCFEKLRTLVLTPN